MSPVKNPEATRIDIPGYAMGGWTTMQGGSMGRGRERGRAGGECIFGPVYPAFSLARDWN